MKEEKLLQMVVDNKLGKELAQLLYDTKKELFDIFDKYACIKNDKWYLELKENKLKNQKQTEEDKEE